MTIKFNQTVRHGRLEFNPDVPLAFEDKDAEPYFIAAGWAEETKSKPARTYAQDEVPIDPATIHGDGPNKGQPVLAAKATKAAAKGGGE